MKTTTAAPTTTRTLHRCLAWASDAALRATTLLTLTGPATAATAGSGWRATTGVVQPHGHYLATPNDHFI